MVSSVVLCYELKPLYIQTGDFLSGYKNIPLCFNKIVNESKASSQRMKLIKVRIL